MAAILSFGNPEKITCTLPYFLFSIELVGLFVCLSVCLSAGLLTKQ